MVHDCENGLERMFGLCDHDSVCKSSNIVIVGSGNRLGDNGVGLDRRNGSDSCQSSEFGLYNCNGLGDSGYIGRLDKRSVWNR